MSVPKERLELTLTLSGVMIVRVGVAADYLGELYTSLEMFALGAALWSKGHLRRSGVPIITLSWLLVYRFVISPAVSIATVWALRKWLPDVMVSLSTLSSSVFAADGIMIQFHDPMFDYVLMLSNTGPPALNLHAVTHL